MLRQLCYRRIRLRQITSRRLKNIDTFLVLIQNKNMDIKRREFMKGMISASLVGGVLIMPGGHYLLQHKTETEQPPQTSEHKAFQLNYDFASVSAAGMAATGFIFNNIEHLYSIMLTLIAITIFLTFGLPTMEYFLYPGAEQAVVKY